jgi:oligopeptide transport system substrate-binding protein
VTVGTLSYRDTVGSVAKAAYPSDARTALQDALEALELSRVPSATLLVADDSSGAAVGGAMQKDWQDTLSAYFNMEPLSVDELESRVQSGEFDFALAPLSALADDATHGLSWFVQLIGEEDEAGIGSLLDTARRQSSALSMAKALFSVEQAIVDEFLALPVYDTPSIFVCRENLSGIRYDPATRIVYFKDAAAS